MMVLRVVDLPTPLRPSKPTLHRAALDGHAVQDVDLPVGVDVVQPEHQVLR
jgi:hypothetical protein